MTGYSFFRRRHGILFIIIRRQLTEKFIYTYCKGDKLKRSSYKYIAICTALTFTAGTFTPGLTAYADESVITELELSTEDAVNEEVLIGVGDGPVDDAELGISSEEDIVALTDGSMIPEYEITDVADNANSVVTENYAEAKASSEQETLAQSSSDGTDGVIEVSDNVTDSGSLSSSISTIAQNLSTMATNIVEASGAAATEEIISVNTAPSSETTSIVSTIKSAVSSLVSGETSIPVIATTASRQALINYAKQFLGNPYVYGGTSLTEGADCSGFVQQIFKYFGITTGRTSRDQIENAQAISYEELQPGDLVFYASGDYVNHVAIYAGNGVIIHAASSSTGICTGRYDYREPYAYGRFLSN